MIQPALGHKSIAALAQFSISETAVADKKREGGASPKCSANAVISSQQDTSVQQLNTNTN